MRGGMGFTPLAMPSATLFSISPAAELAIGLRPQGGTPTDMTLAQAPLLGGAPRSILEGVRFADWSPTGSGLAIVRLAGSHQRLEFPAGKVLYETEGEIGDGDVFVVAMHAQFAILAKDRQAVDSHSFGAEVGAVRGAAH